MSLRQKDTKKIPYWLFSAGSEKTIHLGPVNDPSKIKSDKVKEALEYVNNKFEHYSTVETNLASLLKTEPNVTKALEYYESRTKSVLEFYINKILEFSSFLPQPERNEYLSKRTAELVGMLWPLEQKITKEEEGIKIDTVSMKGAGVLVTAPVKRQAPISSSRSYRAPSLKKIKEKLEKTRKKKEKKKTEKKK